MKKENNNVYIPSLQASNIYEHLHRNKELKFSNVGMIPNSLELDKLKEIGLKTISSKKYNKIMSNDIINIKFKQKVKSEKEIIGDLNKKINKITTNIDINLFKEINSLLSEAGYKDKEYKEQKRYLIEKKYNSNNIVAYFNELTKNNYREKIEEIRGKTDWEEINIDDKIDLKNATMKKGLRSILYTEGFKLNINGKEINYVLYKRSSAKSRTSQVLFINEKLRNDMIKWSRLGINFSKQKNKDIDFPSLLAYESLVSSSAEDLIKIETKNILIISDVKSIFPINCNVVKKNDDDKLVSEPVDGYMMENDIFDGQGLLQTEYFDNIGRSDKSMVLTRQHMFKSCLFRCDIQKFLKDYAKDNNIDFDTWKLTNMFKEPMLAKDVFCVITPNSLKALKFNKIKGSKHNMWKHWKYCVEKEGCLFAIVKSDKESKRGKDYEGNILQQTSYQHLNSMPISYSDMLDLSFFEYEYIMELKNNDEVYIEFLRKNANRVNSNDMLADLYETNKNLVNTELFKDKRSLDIHNYVKHIKKGKIRLNGDYCTILGNGKEMLYHAISKLPVDKKGVLDYEAWESEMILKDNEVYTKLHDFDAEYVAFRNPHTAQSNVLICKNKDNKFIDDYFILSKNIIYVNSINFPICRILSGQDFDSDSVVLFHNCKLLEIAKECYGKYRVCVNKIPIKETNEYNVCNEDSAKIDNILAKSQMNIGTVVNLGQLYMSTYWDLINKGINKTEKLNKLLERIDVCTVLSEIAIDQAKRLYDIDIIEQIKYLNDSVLLSKIKPNFFRCVSQSNKIKTKYYDTSMDYLDNILGKLPDAKDKDNIDFSKLLKDIDYRDIKKKQFEGIIKAINDMSNDIKIIHTKYNKEDRDREYTKQEKKEKYRALEDTVNEHILIVKRYKIKLETMSKIINSKEFDNCSCKIDLLNTLYRLNKEMFLQVFKIN